MSKVTLMSSDNENFIVDKIVAERSILIKNMLEDVGESDMPIPLPNVTSNVLKKVLEWCEHHRSDPFPLADDDLDLPIHRSKKSTEIDEWDQKFMQVDQEMLFEIILASNYLDIKPLLDVGCKTVANMIKNKTPEEIRKTFNIVNDFTQEEEEIIRKEDNTTIEQYIQNITKSIYVKTVENGYQIFIDNHPFKTASGKILEFPKRKRSLSHMIVQECCSSAFKLFQYHLLPLTSLAIKAIDVFSIENERENKYKELIKYLDTDTILFYAPENESGGELLTLQKKLWGPLHEWAQKYWNVDILKINADTGIFSNAQPLKTKNKMISWMRTLDQWQIAALDRAISTSKSFIIGAKMVAMRNSLFDENLSAEKACDLAQLEVYFQTTRWGQIKDSHVSENEYIKQLLESVNSILKDDE
ncbi:hypothetical protein PCANB_001560 [Pneumocystis canis]|nr:hypothetical protein PCK1_001556 [Pneumocystis canis]KAG5439261.1 hypothetical protein PCANB_001560 [Pneumocystis canis]